VNGNWRTSTSLRKMNFHPWRWARTAMSMSSTVVLSNQPPASSKAFILHTPAVPLNPKKLMKIPFTCCSTSKWKDRLMFCNLVSRFSSLFTKDHLAWTSPNSSLSCTTHTNQVKQTQLPFHCSSSDKTITSKANISFIARFYNSSLQNNTNVIEQIIRYPP